MVSHGIIVLTAGLWWDGPYPSEDLVRHWMVTEPCRRLATEVMKRMVEENRVEENSGLANIPAVG